MAVPMTIRIGTHVSLTITSDATICKPCKQQQIASGNELLLVIDSNLLIVQLITIRLGTHLSPSISSDAATLHVCKQQQIASGNKILLQYISL